MPYLFLDCLALPLHLPFFVNKQPDMNERKNYGERTEYLMKSEINIENKRRECQNKTGKCGYSRINY